MKNKLKFMQGFLTLCLNKNIVNYTRSCFKILKEPKLSLALNANHIFMNLKVERIVYMAEL